LIECCVEFVTLISSEANEIAEREAKKTIGADHIQNALIDLGFNEYIDQIKEAADEHKETQKVVYATLITSVEIDLPNIYGLTSFRPDAREKAYQAGGQRSNGRGTIKAAGRIIR